MSGQTAASQEALRIILDDEDPERIVTALAGFSDDDLRVLACCAGGLEDACYGIITDRKGLR